MSLYTKGVALLARTILLNAGHNPLHRSSPQATETPAAPGISTADTVAYQKRELAKELLLLEKHLQQKCKVGGRACDCCTKHPLTIEALAQETLGMTGEGVYDELALWATSISPRVTAEASASGRYDDEYPQMAVRVREFRKRIQGADEARRWEKARELAEKVTRGEMSREEAVEELQEAES